MTSEFIHMLINIKLNERRKQWRRLTVAQATREANEIVVEKGEYLKVDC